MDQLSMINLYSDGPISTLLHPTLVILINGALIGYQSDQNNDMPQTIIKLKSINIRIYTQIFIKIRFYFTTRSYIFTQETNSD